MSRERALERWIDDEFVVGHHLGTLMHAHLDLEEAIAMGSLSQDELSHCSLLCEMLGDADEAAKNRRLLLRDRTAFRCASLAVLEVETWPDAVAKHVLYETADAIRVTALAADTVIAREESLHRRHWWAWAGVLAAGEIGRLALQESVERLWPHTGDLLDLGVETDPDGWLDELGRGFGALGIRVPAPPAPRNRGEYEEPIRAALEQMLERAQSVYRTDPEAVWA